MGLRNYKANEAIRVVYQAKGVGSGLTVTMQPYDETDAVFGTPISMTEFLSTGRYYGTFTPDANGDWSVQITDSNGGEAVKHFSVGDYNIQQIGANLQSVETKVDNLEAPPMIG